MKTRMKRVLAMFVVLVLVSGLFSVTAATVTESAVLTVNASHSSGIVTISGTTTPGALAVALSIYKGSELLRLKTTGVENKAFTTNITISLSAGNYIVKAADYEGGIVKETTFNVAKTSSSSGSNVTTGDTNVIVEVNIEAKTASANLDSIDLAAGKGGNTTVTLKPVVGVLSYIVSLPVASLEGVKSNSLTINTEFANITVSANMLSGLGMTGRAELIIGQGDKTKLSREVREAIGDRPLLQLNLSIDGKKTAWENPNAPVTVSIPNYKPTALELENPENIVVWYIDSSGNAIAVPNGFYDSKTGNVTFKTNHFSDYAIVYNKVSFNDVASKEWYYKAVSFIAARDITKGTEVNKYSPEARLTRGEFIVLMMRAYDISPDMKIKDNFSDAGDRYYTGYLAAAKRLGITEGIGNNLYAPNNEITRQEMFTLLYNALSVVEELPQGNSGKVLADFNDAEQIDAWANTAMKLMVETGTVKGSDGELTPLNTTTRAEMAQVLYNLLSK